MQWIAHNLFQDMEMIKILIHNIVQHRAKQYNM